MYHYLLVGDHTESPVVSASVVSHTNSNPTESYLISSALPSQGKAETQLPDLFKANGNEKLSPVKSVQLIDSNISDQLSKNLLPTKVNLN